MTHRLSLLLTLLFALLSTARADESRFDLDVVDSPARRFFEMLVDGSPYNVILDPAVSGTVTLKLRNVTVPEALDAVRDAYGYDYRRTDNRFLIIPPTLQTQLFQVDYIDLERRGTSRTRVSSGQTGQSSSSLQQQSPQGGSPGGGGGLSEPPGPVFDTGTGSASTGVKEITGTSVSTRSSSDFWRDLEVSLKAIVGTDGGRMIMVNSQSGIIAVRALPRELRNAAEFLHKLQDISTREVVLEAKIVEVELSDAFQSGINWALLGSKNNQHYGGFLTGPQSGFNQGNLLNQPSNQVTLAPNHAITSTVTNTLGGAFALAVNTADFAAYIELLSTQGKTRVLSSPRVSTLNNQKAVIKAGSDQYFVIGVQTNTVVGTSSATNLNVDLAPFFSGVALDVTPQISGDGEVMLHIHPSVSQVTQNNQQVTVAGSTDNLPLALSQIRESDSLVKAKTGQLVVIGGLMQSTVQRQTYALPGLGSIPVVGNLFKSQQNTNVRTELVILLRPTVVESDQQWDAMVKEPSIDGPAAPNAAAGAGLR
jgi:MSHA biogenesis protein MshL